MRMNPYCVRYIPDLTSYDLLRKDLKCVSGVRTVIAMSSLPVHLHVSTKADTLNINFIIESIYVKCVRK